jgi:hypothetical protein
LTPLIARARRTLREVRVTNVRIKHADGSLGLPEIAPFDLIVISRDPVSCLPIYEDLVRLLRTPYRIDDFQQTYFVIRSLQALLDATLQDFGPVYAAVDGAADIPIEAVLESDRVLNRGTQAYALARRTQT